MIRPAILLLAALTVTACAAPLDVPPDDDGAPTTADRQADDTTTTPPASQTVSVPRCGDEPKPTAPDHWYRDEPRYVGNEMPAEEVKAFASTLPGFQILWIDRDRNGWITVGFHGTDIEGRQAELEAEFPGVGVVAVEMPYSQAELEEIRLRVAEALPGDMDASNVREVPGVVEVWVGDLTAERVAQVAEAAGGDPVCIEGWEPGQLPPEGPQLEEGDGWRYLGEVDSGSGFTLRLAADAATWTALWREIGQGDEPPVDFGVEIAVAAEIGYSGSCPETRLDNVVVNRELVYPEVVHTSRQRACTADYNPRIYFFTVTRDRLPAPPFQIASDPDTTQRIQVDADLSLPGSAPSPGDVTEVSVPPPREATPYPLIIEPGYPWLFILDLSCGVERLGEVNSYRWRTDTQVVPDAWRDAEEDGLVDLELLLEEGTPPRLTVSGHGTSLEYRIDDGPPPDCG